MGTSSELFKEKGGPYVHGIETHKLDGRSPFDKRIVVRTVEDCERLARTEIPLSQFGAPVISLHLPLERPSLQSFQLQVDELLGTCGCVTSAVVMLGILAPTLIGLWTVDLAGTSLGARVGWSVGALVVSAGIGLVVKYTIIARSRRHLRSLLNTIASAAKTP